MLNVFYQSIPTKEKIVLKSFQRTSGLTETELEVFVALLSLSSGLGSTESLFPTEEMGNPLSLVSSWELSL